MKYFKYLSYIFRHKWFVIVECFKFGLYWQGITHDLSKLRPSEFFPYVNFFYGTPGSSVASKRDSTGYYKPTDTGDKDFDFAWLLHIRRNKHHWQWWVLPEDEGGIKVLEMPLEYRAEMLCDWIGAGKAQGKPDIAKWYQVNGHKLSLGHQTRLWIEIMIERKFNWE